MCVMLCASMHLISLGLCGMCTHGVHRGALTYMEINTGYTGPYVHTMCVMCCMYVHLSVHSCPVYTQLYIQCVSVSVFVRW